MRIASIAMILALVALTVVTGCKPDVEPPADGGVIVEEPPVEIDPPADAEQTAPATTEEETLVSEGTETIVKIATEKGDIVCRLFDEKAPITAGSFILLIDDGFYDGLTIHRVDPGFVIQGGCPDGNGFGGPGFTIPLEVSPELKHDRGVLSMASSSAPDSAGSQFFVCLGGVSRVGFLDNDYAVFGEVTEGMDVVDSIAIGDVMTSVTIESESPFAAVAREAAAEARIQ